MCQLQRRRSARRVSSNARTTTAPSPSTSATCTTTAGTTRMRSSVSCGLVSPGSSAARTTSVWPRRGSVMGTTTAEMARMKSTAVSGYSPHGVVSEGLSLIFPGLWFQFLTLGLACCEEYGCIRRIRIQKFIVF